MAITNYIKYLENPAIPYRNYLLTFVAAITLRNFLEAFSQNMWRNYLNLPSGAFLTTLIHFNLFYLTVAILITIIAYLTTHVAISKITRVVASCFIIVTCVPLVDIILYGGAGYNMYYLTPDTHALWYYFGTWYHNCAGISWGQRSEIFLVCLGLFCYARYKQASIFRSILAALLGYTAIFLLAITPYVFKILHTEITNLTLINYYLTLLIPLSVWLAWLSNKKIFTAVAKDLRWLRLCHFTLMLALGMVLALPTYTPYLVLRTCFCLIAILSFCLFAIINNNIADIEIDEISNPQRPLVQHQVALPTYTTIGYVALVVCSMYALASSLITWLGLAICALSYYLYSTPPWRLKRIPLLAKAIPALTSLIITLIGYHLASGQSFPPKLAWLIFSSYTLAANVIDIKDYAGDKANHILTLPVVLGETTAKKLIGIIFILANLSWWLYFNELILLPLFLIAGGLTYYCLNKKHYQEWQVFSIYLLSILILISYLITR